MQKSNAPDADGQAAVRESEKVLAERANIPDGPNVAPSPLEHLAAQGIVPDPAGPAGSTSLPPSEKSPGNSPAEPVDPAEQGLVEEQLRHDSAAARQTDPPSSEKKAS